MQTSAPTSVKSGSDLTYTITVSNAGPSSAWQVVLRDELPFGTQFLKASPGGAQCAAPRAGTKGGTLVCKLGTIKSGKTAGSQRVQVKITASANQGVITDTARVLGVTPDPLVEVVRDLVEV